MKLTKLQRYTLYCILLEEAENINIRNSSGLCKLISDVTGWWPYFHDYLDCTDWIPFEKLAPELFKYNNDVYGLYWFANWGERIKALKQCIEETHP